MSGPNGHGPTSNGSAPTETEPERLRLGGMALRNGLLDPRTDLMGDCRA